MKFLRKDLVNILEQIIDKDDKNIVLREKALKEADKDHRAEWTKNTLPKWIEYRDALTKAIRGGVIESKDFNREKPAWYTTLSDNGYRVPPRLQQIYSDYPLLHEARKTDLKSLLAAMKMIQEDEISDNQLGRLGFGASSISMISREAVAAGVEVE